MNFLFLTVYQQRFVRCTMKLCTITYTNTIQHYLRHIRLPGSMMYRSPCSVVSWPYALSNLYHLCRLGALRDSATEKQFDRRDTVLSRTRECVGLTTLTRHFITFNKMLMSEDLLNQKMWQLRCIATWGRLTSCQSFSALITTRIMHQRTNSTVP